MARAKKKAGDINSSSMADIAFLLLIFFLVTTTMDVDTGMKRTLPPWIDPTEQQNDVDVNERNVLKVNVSRNGGIMVGTEEYRANDLKRSAGHSRLSREVYHFLVDADKSSKKATEIEGQTYDISDNTRLTFFPIGDNKISTFGNTYRGAIQILDAGNSKMT